VDDELSEALEAHLHGGGFPPSMPKAPRFGLVDPVMIGSDLYGWSIRVRDGQPISNREIYSFRKATDELSASLITIPTLARLYYVRIVLFAELALARIASEV
jgi:hypothetical protein